MNFPLDGRKNEARKTRSVRSKGLSTNTHSFMANISDNPEQFNSGDPAASRERLRLTLAVPGALQGAARTSVAPGTDGLRGTVAPRPPVRPVTLTRRRPGLGG